MCKWWIWRRRSSGKRCVRLGSERMRHPGLGRGCDRRQLGGPGRLPCLSCPRMCSRCTRRTNMDLQAAMHEWGADVVGSAAAAQGHGGVRLWIHKKLCIPANKIRVTSSSSRHTLAAIRCPSLRLDIFVGHAPVQDEQGKQDMWWREITAMVQGRPQPRADLVALLDADGWVSSISSLAVGAVEPQEEDAGGELLHEVPGQVRLDGGQHLRWHKTTHVGAYQGPGGTDRLCGLPAALASDAASGGDG